MTIKLLAAITIGGVRASAGADFTLDAALEAELVQRGVAEYVLGTTFSEGTQRYTEGAAEVTIVATAADVKAVDARLARFDAAADMPASITTSGDISSKRIKFDSFQTTARRLRLVWHGAGIAGPDTQSTQAFFGELALGARVTINAPDDVTANNRLLFSDLTGGGISSAGAADTFVVSKSNPIVDIVVEQEIARIDAIGIPNGLTATHIDTPLPCFLEVQVLG